MSRRQRDGRGGPARRSRKPTSDALEILRRIARERREEERQLARMRSCKERLAKRCPAEFEVRVRLAYLRDGLFGDCDFVCPRKGRPYFSIRLSVHQDERTMVDTLAHEWAHALAWRTDNTDHGPGWGVAYARCYRASMRVR